MDPNRANAKPGSKDHSSGSWNATRREFFVTGIAGLTGIALGAGITGLTESSIADAAPKRGGTLNYALQDNPDRLDPNLSGGFRFSQVIFFQIYDPLIALDQRDKKFKPWLATSWQVSPNGLDYTFKLRPNVKFHDGTPFDASVVKFNFDRTHDPKLATRCIGCAVGFYDHTEVIDPLTVRIHLKSPWAPFLDAASLYYRMVSPAGVKQFGNDDFGRHPVGTGPFKFVEWVPNDHITLERNEDYNWASPMFDHNGPAYLDRVIFRIIPEDGTRVGALESGEVQVVDTAPPQEVERLAKDPHFKVLVGFVPGIPFDYAINVTKPPTDELAVRQAMSYGIDRPAIAKIVFGPYQKYGAFAPAYGVLTQYTLGYDKNADSYHYNPDRAKLLLEQAGWKLGPDGIRQKGGQRLTIAIGSPYHGMPEVVQAQLKQVGIDVKLVIGTWLVVNENQSKGVTHLSPIPTPRTDPDTLSAGFHSRNVGGGGANRGFVKDPVLDRLLDAQAVESNQSKRLQILDKVQERIMGRAYPLAVYNFDNISLMSSGVQDLRFDATGFMPWTYDAWLGEK